LKQARNVDEHIVIGKVILEFMGIRHNIIKGSIQWTLLASDKQALQVCKLFHFRDRRFPNQTPILTNRPNVSYHDNEGNYKI